MDNANLPAFPFEYNSWEDREPVRKVMEGLTKREYFASMAMQGFLASADFTDEDGRYTVNGKNTDRQYISKEAIALADELLNQLNSTA